MSTCVVRMCASFYVLYVGDERPHPSDIVRQVIPNYATQWRELGVSLGTTSCHLDLIHADYPHRCVDRCRMMLMKWLRQDISATWGKLVDAIETISTTTSNIEGSKANTSCMINRLMKKPFCKIP